jgi:hypothetical protein
MTETTSHNPAKDPQNIALARWDYEGGAPLSDRPSRKQSEKSPTHVRPLRSELPPIEPKQAFQ